MRRFRRPLPGLFLLVTVLIFLGGVIYAPTNFDALTYRLPRILNWQAAGHWCWISTFNQRMNYSGTGWEWLGMPFVILFHSDRGMFLINAIGFLFMPGLLFAIFRHLGMAGRVARTWMWLLPLAYGYATQAGGVGNDLLGTVFFLLSLYFGLRAGRTGRFEDVGLALLAAALMTGVKFSNLPLALPCLVAVWRALIRSGRHWPAALAVSAVCILISALPVMALNQRYTGSWTGDPDDHYQMQIKNPVAALMVNGFLAAEYSLVPPVLPLSKKINERLTLMIPDSIREHYPRLELNKLTEFPGEEGAGLGLGVTLPLLLVLAVALGKWRGSIRVNRIVAIFPPVVLAAWVALIFLMAKLGSEAVPRLLLPYYPLVIFPVLMLSPQRRWLQCRAWRAFLCVLAAGVLPVLILSVSRPLWPAISISGWLARTHPQNALFQRLAATYSGYDQRNDFLAPIRSVLPTTVSKVGLIAGSNDSAYSLWRPFGMRQVVELRVNTADFLAHPDKIEWVVIKENIWPEISPISLEAWSAAHHAEQIASVPIVELISRGPENWCVLHFAKPEHLDHVSLYHSGCNPPVGRSIFKRRQSRIQQDRAAMMTTFPKAKMREQTPTFAMVFIHAQTEERLHGMIGIIKHSPEVWL